MVDPKGGRNGVKVVIPRIRGQFGQEENREK